MDASEYTIGENERAYVNPTLSRDEQLGFVDQLRDTMARNTAQVNAQTQALGTNVPSSLGGLTGSNSYFAQRYQTMPLEAKANELKATAQAKALNDLMTNYEKQYANRANQAYRTAKRRSITSNSGDNTNASQQGGVTFEEDEWAPNTEATPPKEEDYYVTGDEQTQRISERTGLPDWLVNVLKVFGAA